MCKANREILSIFMALERKHKLLEPQIEKHGGSSILGQGEKNERTGSVKFAEKGIFPKLYFSALFGLKDVQFSKIVLPPGLSIFGSRSLCWHPKTRKMLKISLLVLQIFLEVVFKTGSY